MSAPLTVIPGGRNQPERIEVERAAWDETRIALTVSRGDRIVHARQQHRLLTGALAALYQVQPDVERAERYLSASLRLLAQEAVRAASDIEDDGPAAVARAA